jgi:surface polysaccharide O-acyltransferase-like enzyme
MVERNLTLERNDTIDFIKFFAIFFICSIHTLPFSTYQSGGLDGEVINFYINLFARFGVPYFFVVSGYLLAQKLVPADYKWNYFKKYLLKIIKLFVSWSVFYFLYDVVMTILKSYLLGLNVKVELLNYLYSVFNISNLYYGLAVGTSYHLWYLPALIWSILILYLFVKWEKVGILLMLSFILHVIGLFGQSYAAFVLFPPNTRDALFFGLYYVTLGYYFVVKIKDLKVPLKPKLYLFLFFVFSLLQIGEGAILVFHYNAVWGNYYLMTVLTTLLLLLFVHTKPNLHHSFINKVGANSVGIYVIHPLFISIAYSVLNILNMKDVTQSIGWNIVFTPFIFILSYYSYHLLQVIKFRLKTKKEPSLR